MADDYERRLDQIERESASVRAAQSQHEAVCAERYQRLIGGQDRAAAELTRHRDTTEAALARVTETLAGLTDATARRTGADAVITRIYGVIGVLFGGTATALLAHFWPGRP